MNTVSHESFQTILKSIQGNPNSDHQEECRNTAGRWLEEFQLGLPTLTPEQAQQLRDIL